MLVATRRVIVMIDAYMRLYLGPECIPITSQEDAVSARVLSLGTM